MRTLHRFDYAFSHCVDAQMALIRVFGPPGIIGYHTFKQLHAIWQQTVGATDKDMKFFQDMMDLEDMLYPKAIGAWIQLSTRGVRDTTLSPLSTPGGIAHSPFFVRW